MARLIATISEATTLSLAVVLVTGAPSGVGAVRSPPLWAKPGDIREVGIERIGPSRNAVVDEPGARAASRFDAQVTK